MATSNEGGSEALRRRIEGQEAFVLESINDIDVMLAHVANLLRRSAGIEPPPLE